MYTLVRAYPSRHFGVLQAEQHAPPGPSWSLLSASLNVVCDRDGFVRSRTRGACGGISVRTKWLMGDRYVWWEGKHRLGKETAEFSAFHVRAFRLGIEGGNLCFELIALSLHFGEQPSRVQEIALNLCGGAITLCR